MACNHVASIVHDAVGKEKQSSEDTSSSPLYWMSIVFIGFGDSHVGCCALYVKGEKESNGGFTIPSVVCGQSSRCPELEA